MWAAIAAFLNGAHAGALGFVSCVETRTLGALADGIERGHEVLPAEMVPRFFAVWWPHGRDMMAPLGLAATAAHVAAFREAGQAGHRQWLLCAGLVFFSLPWTMVLMGESISELQALKGRGAAPRIVAMIRTFCWRHHLRTITSAAAFALSLGLLEGRPVALPWLSL
mmetsp:Transcript_12326/g.34841  ORF Transcript_12326/g.34841 Transcript_12326/m.34841 type:complete len:167 (+) Transcript_12326:267-767(+)